MNTLEPWHDFMVALVGAGAALAGLVFVAISINLARVVAQKAIAARAFEAVIELTLLPVIGLLALIPGQSLTWFGGELIVLGLLAAFCVVRANMGAAATKEVTLPQRLSRVTLSLIATLPLVIAGMTGAWVLLVEILR